MSQKLIDIQHHKHLLQKRDRLDRYMAENDILEYRDKALRFREEIVKETFLKWLINEINNE